MTRCTFREVPSSIGGAHGDDVLAEQLWRALREGFHHHHCGERHSGGSDKSVEGRSPSTSRKRWRLKAVRGSSYTGDIAIDNLEILACTTAPTASPTASPTNAGDTHAPTASPTVSPSASPSTSPTTSPTTVLQKYLSSDPCKDLCSDQCGNQSLHQAMGIRYASSLDTLSRCGLVAQTNII